MKFIYNSPLAFFLAVLILFPTSCTTIPHRENIEPQQAEQPPENLVGTQARWVINARISVSDGNDHGSGQMQWRQEGDKYEFNFRAPVTGKTWRLHGDANNAVLEGVKSMPMVGSNAEQLLQENLGWRVPMKELVFWVRGLQAPGSRADLTYNDQHLPKVLQQAGWKVEYKQYFTDKNPPLPRKVFASKKNYQVRLVIEQWNFSSTDG